MPSGRPVPENERGALDAWAADVVSDFRSKWTSPRGRLVWTALDGYRRAGNLKWEVLDAPENAVWRSNGEIAIFIVKDATQARLMRAPNRCYCATNPGGWLVSADDYSIDRKNLAINLAHEGLHAAMNTPGDGTVSEELDARLAANAAAAALALIPKGLAQPVGASLATSLTEVGKDYVGLPVGATYVHWAGVGLLPGRRHFKLAHCSGFGGCGK
jgi:hypothetical protein